MARLSDITSTEKLLKAIRSRKDSDAPAPSSSAVPLRRKTGRKKIALPGLLKLKKTSTVGIDIGHDCLRLVRAVETSGDQWKILGRWRFPLPRRIPRDAPEFASFLKSSLASACGSSKQSDLWLILSQDTDNLDVRHIRIPSVPKRQIANVVYWTVKKETPFDEKETLLDFEMQGEVVEQGISKLAVMVYLAPRREVEEQKALFARIGWPLTGISIAPFSTQNLFRTGWIDAGDGTVATLFIGNDFSQIDLFSSARLMMTRGIKAGLSSMVEALVDRFNELKQDPSAPSLTIEQGWSIVRSLSPDSPPLQQGDPGFHLRKEEIFEMIQPALERLTRQVTRTFEHYITTMPDEQIVRVHLASALNGYPPIVDYFGAQLGIASALLDPLGRRSRAAVPEAGEILSLSERIAFGPAVGLAFSGNGHTPNLLFTYKEKDRDASVIRINRAVFAVFIVSVLVCAGIFTFQNYAIAKKRTVVAGIETEIARLGQPVDRNRLLQMAAKVAQRRQLSSSYADRYLGMVLISELAALTPANIRFTDLKISFGPPPAANAPKQAQDAPKARVEEVTVEGLILGERKLFETSLATYTLSLEASPLFQKVTIQKNTVAPYVKGEALHFILNMKVEEQVRG